MTKRPRFYYGWVIVGIAFMANLLIYGIRNTFSVFFPSILGEFDWSRGSTAIMLSLNLLVYGLLAPVAGTIGERWKPRRVIPIGIIIVGLATAGCAFAQKLWHFYLLFGILVPIGSALCGNPMVTPALTNWFVRKRGLIMGLSQMGGSLSFTYAVFAQLAISQWGWRTAYFVLAAILMAILLPLTLLFFRYRPEEKGLRAYDTAESGDPAAQVAAVEPPTPDDRTLLQTLRTYQLWLLVMSEFLFWGMAAYLILAHQVKFAEDAGYSSMFAASVFAIFGILNTAGAFSSSISDYIGREATITVAGVLTIGAIITLMSVRDTSQPWLLYVYAISFGYGVGLFTPTLFAGLTDIFYGRHFAVIFGLLLTGMGIGGAIGPWLGGHIYDISGSYISAFVLSIVCIALSCITFWIAAPRNGARPLLPRGH